MSGGVKVALVLGAAAVGAYFILRSSGSSILGGAVPGATAGPLTQAPGAPAGNGTSTSAKVGTALGSYAFSAGLGVATGGVGLLFTSTGRNAIKSVASTGYSAAKTVAGDAGSAISSGVHDVLSIF